jgi:hypothetical protein
MKTLHEYKGVDEYSNRSARVVHDGNDYGVIYKINDIEEHRVFPDRSMHYVEDAAENWVMGVFSLKDLQISY